MSHRLFIGIRPPASVRDALIDTMEALEGARWQDDEQLHLTLRFIGQVERPTTNDLASALARIVWPSFELTLEGVSYFERKAMPSAIWARIPLTPELGGLRAKIERVCDLEGLGRETRRFTPHITIARLTRDTGPIAPWVARHSGLRTTWQAEGFTLFESHLLGSGAHYEVVAHYPLRG
ncbi:RNA 2',3'-cyclic phosphodiesterase [Parasphingorhabdus sp.]|uniref:RNA 2',3'-cyclic phosphodiesterase n=1 Tax=Parasphingorhabdus sp. TaxID=2709688 RepID=UPI002F949CD0